MSPSSMLVFSSFIFRKDRRNREKIRQDSNGRLKNYCKKKNIGFIKNNHIKTEHLEVKSFILAAKDMRYLQKT